MTEAWFYAPPERWRDSEVALPPDESHHAVRVLRINPPDVITVFDGRGVLARCAAARQEGDVLVAEILERDERRRPRPAVAVYQATPKGSKGDEVAERLAEMGVAELAMFGSERSVARWDARKAERVGDRWRSIARSAAKQSRNPFLMQAEAGLSWTELVRRIAREPLAIVLWEGASLPLRVALDARPERVALVVGPEGGFTRPEAEELADAGALLVSLGPLILRTEHAPIVAVSALLFHYGLIG